MNKQLTALALTALLSVPAGAQQLREGYVDWGIRGPEFPEALAKWERGQKWTDDDNFFISRVKPHTRFRNEATQVNPELTKDFDKNLIFWVPINGEVNNALPDGKFDCEVFPMWSYVTHYGNWSSRLVRIPAAFIDAAHRNGVPVSCVATPPWGQLTDTWKKAFNSMIATGADKMADFMAWFGVDGIGYNSEFSTKKALVADLLKYNENLRAGLRKRGMEQGEIIWYDGTSESGSIRFDNGLGSHNAACFGDSATPRSVLFFNYNWNRKSLLGNSSAYAKILKRSPLDLYCGINMQGKEPREGSGDIWPLLAQYHLSIGLWGAHAENMFFESRMEKGPDPLQRQRAYLDRVNTWFTGGTHNPVTSPDLNNSLIVSAENEKFAGMSKMMSARSALGWDLSEEPFLTNFNLGNGRFFNFRGQRQNTLEWYNIGIQDHLPTWQWWWSRKFLGRDAASAAGIGLKAEFSWDDAWLGGSLLRIYGTNSADEYLHLFKTDFLLSSEDNITVRYKLAGGKTNMKLALSAKGAEEKEISLSSMLSDGTQPIGEWQTRVLNVGRDLPELSGKTLAMVALRFNDASGLDLRLGEFAITRGDKGATYPPMPEITKAEVLHNSRHGVDAKVIFNMINGVTKHQCYNTDVATSLFKLYAQQDGCEPIMMGMTSSWAGLVFSVPVNPEGGKTLRLGVSALSLDMTNETPISWSEPMDISTGYTIDDEIASDKEVYAPGEAIGVGYVDPMHQGGEFTLTDDSGNVVGSAKNALRLELAEGLAAPGNYTLTVVGTDNSSDAAVLTTRTFPRYIQVVPASAGAVPQVEEFTTAKGETEASAQPGENVDLKASVSAADGEMSRGVQVGKNGVGFKAADAGIDGSGSFSVAFWFRADSFKNRSAQLLNIRDRMQKWYANMQGWFLNSVKEDGTMDTFTIRGNSENLSYNFDKVRLEPKVWYHIAYVFDMEKEGGVLPSLYINGEKQEVTSWSIGNEQKKGSDLGYAGGMYNWSVGNVVAVGGFLHNSGSALGRIDNLSVWNKALDAEGVKVAMGSLAQGASKPEGLAGWYDFENDAAADYLFSDAAGGACKAGAHDYIPTEWEGQGTLDWRAPEYVAGCPWLDNNGYKLSTHWALSLDGTEVAAGDAKDALPKSVKMPNDNRDCVLTLKASNAHGISAREIRVKVGTGSVEEIAGAAPENLNVGPNPFDSYFQVEATEAGNYEFVLYDASGAACGRWTRKMAAGETATIAPAVSAGLYVLTVSRDGNRLAPRRLLKR